MMDTIPGIRVRSAGMGLIDAMIVDGSFVTAEPAPNGIDLVLVVSAHSDFSVDYLPAHDTLLSQRRVRQ